MSAKERKDPVLIEELLTELRQISNRLEARLAQAKQEQAKKEKEEMRTKHAAGWNVARKHTTARKMLELAGNGGTVKCMKVRRTNKTWIPNQIKERVCHTLPEIYNFFFGPLGADKLIRDELVLSGVINSEDPVDVVDGQLAIPADA